MTLEEIVVDLANKLPPGEKKYLAELEKYDLSQLHHGYGTHIRNTYGLWIDNPLTKNWRENEDGRDIRGGVDYSVDHPDAVSMRIIEELWEYVRQPARSPNYADSCEPFHHES